MPEAGPDPAGGGSGRALAVRAWGLGALLAGLGVGLLTLGVPGPTQLRTVVADAGPWLPVGVGSVAAVAAVLLVPRGVPAVLAGVLLPPAVAVPIAVAGIVAGATVAFWLGRGLGRPYLAHRTALATPAGRLARLQGWLDRDGTRAVIYARVIPVLPFGLLNYVFGATTVRTGPFILGTALGIGPSTVAYTLLGASAQQPGSPAFLVSLALVAGIGGLGAAHAYRARVRAGRRRAPGPARCEGTAERPRRQ